MSGIARALYVHIPFCTTTCPYCDFNSITVHERIDEYVAALSTELRAAAGGAGPLASIYFGGGTPSLLDVRHVSALSECIRSTYALEDECEWTIEANPGTVTVAKAAAWSDAGINRVSLGVQSLDPEVLRTLGRTHTPAAALRAFDIVRTTGLTNINLDLMYGVPGQTIGSFAETLRGVLRLEVTHVSAYHLTVESGTPFGAAARAGFLSLPDEKLVLQQRALVDSLASEAGLDRYEISNYALPGFACRHNLAYWRHEPYLGCGAGAVGFDGLARTRNLASVDAYIAAVAEGGCGVGSRETLDADTRMFEEILNGLRLTDGVDNARFAVRHGRPLEELRGEVVPPLVEAGLLEFAEGRWRLTARGVPVANEITLRFLA